METTILPLINLAVVVCTVLVSVVAAFGAGRLGARRAYEQAAAAWRDLAEARAQEVAEVRADVALLKADLAHLKDDKKQLRELNAQLLAENGNLRSRVTGLEAEVKALTRQMHCDHITCLEREAGRRIRSTDPKPS